MYIVDIMLGMTLTKTHQIIILELEARTTVTYISSYL